MKKINIMLLALIASVLTAAAQDSYTILSECDTLVKAQLGGDFSFGSRQVRHIVYE